jgi:hypothetical protein
MRTNLIVTVTAITIASTGTAYYFSQDTAEPGHVEVVKPAISSTSRLNVTETPLRDERPTSPASPEQQRLALMNEKIASLEARLRDMEAAAHRQAQDHSVPRSDKPEVNKDTDQVKTKKLSEADFAKWMDEVLDRGGSDREATKLTMEQMETSLAEVPGTNLTDMRCNDRFCRASFVAESGKEPNISELFGVSPFIGSGTTIPEPDGSVTVYFTQVDQSLGELRKEAREVAFGDIHSE